MTTKIINRRMSDPDDSERMAKRRSVREAAARRDLELQPALLAEASVRASEARCDAAADEHATTTAPWQEELSTLEQAAIARIGRREPPNAEEDARRTELTKLIAETTSDLEKKIAEEREIQNVARRKARLCRQGNPPSDTILMQLARPPLANPRLLTEQHACKQRVMWLEARRKAAEKSLKIQESNIAEIRAGRMSGDAKIVSQKVALWQAELTAAGDELSAALKTTETVHQKLMSE